MTTRLFTLILLLPLTVWSAELPADSVFARLQARINANTLSQFDPATRLDSLVQTLRPDGSWPDLDYAGRDRARWQPASHWDRILVMSQAYRSVQHPFYGRSDVKTALVAAVGYWNRTKPTSGIFWWNAIGVPLKMGESLLLLGDDLPGEARAQTVSLMKLGVKPDYYEYHGQATGQNQVWLATVHLMTGVLERNSQTLQRSFGALHDELKVTMAEGIQPDWSFHQHGTILYAGGYGLAFTRDIARLMKLAEATPYQFPAEKVAIFSGYVLDGQQWMIRGRTFDHSAVGREIARPASYDSKMKGGLPAVGQLLAQLDIPRRAEFTTMAGRMAGTDRSALAGNRHFWRVDLMTHHRPAYYSSVKMASNRIMGSESGNGENGRAYFLGHGVHLLYRTGDEYKNIMPVWDWRRLPGHLGEQSPEPLPLIDWGKGAEGSTAFVGGVSDGQYGGAAYDYKRGNVTAKRAWFHFDTEIVCVGAGLTCATDNPLFQSLNQCHLKGDVLVAGETPESAPRKLATGQHVLSKTRWVMHDSVAYVFPDAPTVYVRNDVQTGAWRDINNSPAQSDKMLQIPVFSAWLDFGKQVRNGAFAYIVRPGVSAADMNEYINPIIVLRNDSTLQAVRHSALRQTQAAFYQPGTLSTGDGLTFSVDKPVMLLVKNEGGTIDVTVANPAESGLLVTASVDKHVTCPGCQWSAKSGKTTIPIQLPTGGLTGQSVTTRLIFTGKK